MHVMRILITGGAGYLGSIMVGHLLEAGHSITVVDSLQHNTPSLQHYCADKRFDFIRGDSRDEALIKRCVKDADVIIPLAADVGVQACDRDPQHAKSTNFDAIVMLLKLRSPKQLVVYPTTNSGYGTKSGTLLCTEETPLEPISLYGQTKVDAEAAVLAAPNSITLRLATVFGMSSRMRLDLLVNHFVYTAVTDRYLVIFEKHFKRNYIHVRDVADTFVHCIKNSEKMVGKPYNAGLDAANLSKEELALAIKKHVPNFFIHFAEVGSDPDKRNYIVSNQRLREAGFEAKRSLDDGIQELIKGYRMMPLPSNKNA
jgi:nucleoside-diphosphate-sugar epimerase